MIYLASPYSSPDAAIMEWRFDAVCRAAGLLMKAGHVVYSPIAHSHPIAMRCNMPTDFEFWRHIDETMIARCDEVVVLLIDGWAGSAGIGSEIEIARRLNKPIRAMQFNGLDTSFDLIACPR